MRLSMRLVTKKNATRQVEPVLETTILVLRQPERRDPYDGRVFELQLDASCKAEDLSDSEPALAENLVSALASRKDRNHQTPSPRHQSHTAAASSVGRLLAPPSPLLRARALAALRLALAILGFCGSHLLVLHHAPAALKAGLMRTFRSPAALSSFASLQFRL